LDRLVSVEAQKTILEGPSYSIFINSLKTKATKSRYSKTLEDFAKWKGAKSLDDLLVGDQKSLSASIIEYIKKLETDGLSYSSRSNAFSAIRHFYEMNYVVLAWKKIYGSVGEFERKYDNTRPYTHEEIAKLLSIADLKYRAMILLMCSSGIRVGAIPDIKYSHLEKMLGYDIYKIHIYKKSKEKYYTFCTPEAYTAINEYLGQRKGLGEIITNDTPLFRTDPNTDSRIRTKSLHKIKHPSPLRYSAIKTRFYNMSQKCGLLKAQKTSTTNKLGVRRNELQMIHGFRKFFATQLENSDIGGFHNEALMGHAVGLRAIYRVTPEKRLMEYAKALPNLTIDQSQKLELENTELKQKNAEIESLKAKINSMQQTQDQLTELSKKLYEAGILKKD